jgi:hypothetical protein
MAERQATFFVNPDLLDSLSKLRRDLTVMKAKRCVRHSFMVSMLVCTGLCVSMVSSGEGAPSAKPSAPKPADIGTPEAFSSSVQIPGPLRSFLRMAAISQQVSRDEVLPLLARNVAMEGYGWRGKRPQPTEYLLLLEGYLYHAKQLQDLAGPQGIIRVSDCTQAQQLLLILGYRLQQGCGPKASLIAANAKKAFLTIDSGFPLTDLEDSLRLGKPFVYAFPSSQVPILSSPSDWVVNEKVKVSRRRVQATTVVGSLVGDPALARLYWALSRMDPNTRHYLYQSEGVRKLVPLAPVLNFYGTDIEIRSGRVVVPGGPSAESAWKSLVGANPKSPRAFIVHLLSKDQGWLAAYFDALSRADTVQQAYFTQPRRLRSFYRALRGRSPFPSPVRPVFRPDPGLVLLTTQLQLGPSGEPEIPGGLEVWREILSRDIRSHARIVRLWAARAGTLKNPDQLIAAMFAFSRLQSENTPLHLFLTLSDIDRRRSPQERLSPETVRLLAEKYQVFGDQYPIFAEFQALDGASIARFVSVAESLSHIRERTLRTDAVGIFQANVGLWQILARQGEIPVDAWNYSWQRTVNPFTTVRTAPHLFDAAQISLETLMQAASGSPDISQDKLVDLLAGPPQTSAEGQQIRQKLADRIALVMEAQRLASLDTLLPLADGLKQMARGKPAPPGLIRLAGSLREFRMPKPLFTSSERAEWSYGLYSNPHIQAETATNLVKYLRSRHSALQIAMARGQLVPFLRDTLVGLNYGYYQPPAAQVLYNSPYFVRSHDFSGESIMGRDQSWKTPTILGRGWTASGGAHLVGSLVNLPYVLAEVEQDFIVPQNVQALIWEDLVPTLLTDAVVPRWWRVTPDELHAVSLYQTLGEQLITAAGKDMGLRQRVMNILSQRMLPDKSAQIQEALRAGRPDEALAEIPAAQTFFLAEKFRRLYPQDINQWEPAGQELDRLAQQHPNDVSWKRLSEDFGVPHPALAGTYACELLNVKPFPTFLGYSSRLLAESWQSNNLYWARIVDQRGDPPAMLNLLVPNLTQRMIANIFATHLQDRPALLRALRETGTEFRQGLLVSSVRRDQAGSGN